jgi:hypothetical protein
METSFEARTIIFSLRLTPHEKRLLSKLADCNGIGQSGLLRQQLHHLAATDGDNKKNAEIQDAREYKAE